MRLDEKTSTIYFTGTERDEEEFFRDRITAWPVAFCRKLEEVPEDAEIISIFINDRITDSALNRFRRLRLIATRTTAWDHIDLMACEQRGIKVCTVCGYGDTAVAEHTFALILALSRKLRDSYEAVRTGRYRPSNLRGFDLKGKVLGVVGAGRIGLHVIRIAHGFGMRVIVYDTQPKTFYSDLLDFEYVTFDNLLSKSDIITLHVPLTESTRYWFNDEVFAKCKPGTFLINTARGAIIDSAALVRALDNGQLAGVGLDVLEEERVFFGGASNVLAAEIAARVRANNVDHRIEDSSSAIRIQEIESLLKNNSLLRHPRVVFTPHVAYNSFETIVGFCELTVQNISDFLNGRPMEFLSSVPVEQLPHNEATPQH